MGRPVERRLDAIDPNKNATLDDALTLTGAKIFDGAVTIADGTNDFDVASHDGTNGLKLGGVLVAATAAELNKGSATTQTETVAAAGAISVTKKITKLALVGAGAVTLAAPDATMLGVVKIIEMTADNGDVTLALTNVTGQSTGTTATFNDVGDALTLIGGVSKWHVLGEAGLGLA